jgi:hypothetical protein
LADFDRRNEQFIAVLLWRMKNRIAEITSASMRDYKSFLDNNKLSNAEIVKLNNGNT